MPAIHLPANLNHSIERPTSHMFQPREDSTLRNLVFNIMAILLAAATLAVACFHLSHQRKNLEIVFQTHGMYHPQQSVSSGLN